MSHVVEGMQGFMNQPLDIDQFLRAWLIPLGIATVSIMFGLRALANRLAAQ